MADLNSSLEEQFFDISIAQREAVIQPHGILDDACGKTMTVRLRVSRHSKTAYPNLT